MRRLLCLLGLVLMATYAKHLVFPKATGVETQTIDTIGFRGTAAIFWTTKQTATGLATQLRWSTGLTDGTHQVAGEGNWPDASASPTGTQAESQSTVLQIRAVGGTSPVASATFGGFTANGFMLNWTVNDGSADLIHVVVIHCTEVKLVTVPTTGAAINDTQDVSVGFQPDAIIWMPGQSTDGLPFATAYDEVSFQAPSFSQPSAVKNQMARLFAPITNTPDHEVSSGDVIRIPIEDHSINLGSVSESLYVSALTSDGFTLKNNASFGLVNHTHFALCLRGLSNVKVGSIVLSGTGDTTASLGFRPSLVLGLMGQQGAVGPSSFSVGAWDAIEGQSVATIAAAQSGGSTVALRRETSDAIARTVTPSPGGSSTDHNVAEIASVDDDGFTLHVTTYGGGSPTFAYFALGTDAIPSVSCSGGTVPTVADPDDGLEFTGLGPHEDRCWVEVDLDSGTRRYALHEPLNDPPTLSAHAGRKEGRLVSIGSIVRRTTDRLGAWQASTARFTLDDGDRAIRGLIAADRWYNREVRIYVAKRGQSDQARCLFRGIIREYPPQADASSMTVDVEALDIIGTEFTPFSLDRDVLAGVVFDRTRFTGLPQALADQKPPQPVPALWGKWSDEGSETAPPVLAGSSARGTYFSSSDGRVNVGFANQPAGGPAAPDTVSGTAVSGGSITLGMTPYNEVYAIVWGETAGVEGDPLPFYAELLPISITANGQKIRITWTFGGSDPDHWRVALFVKYAGPRQVETIQVAGSARVAEFDNLPWAGNGALATGATAPAYANRREFLVAARMPDGLTGVSNPSGIHPYGGPYKRKPYLSWLPIAGALKYEVYTGAVPAAAYFGWTQQFVVPADQIDADGYVYLEYDWDAAGESINGLPSPEGLLPLYDVGDETIAGVVYGKLVLCRWPIHAWLGLHAAKQRIALDHADILHADHPDWPFADRYRLCGDAACTVLYVKVGSDLLNAHRDGSAPIQANACTTEDVGDGTGSTITQAARIAQDVITELVFNDRHGATRAGVPLFADGVPTVRTSTYTAAETMQIARVGGTGYDNARISFDTAGTSLRDVIEQLVQSFGLHHGIGALGQVICGHYDDAVDTTQDYPHYRDIREIVGALGITPRTDELENVIPYRTDRRPVDQSYAIDLDENTTDILDATAITANRGKRKPGPQRTLDCTADATTIADVMQRLLLLGKYVRQWVEVPTSIIGLSTELFDIIRVTDEEGLGANGYQEQFILVLEHQVDPPDPSQDRPLTVTLRGLDITALADAAFVWGPDALTDWDAMTDDEQGTYGAFAAEDDTIPSDSSPAKEWR